MCIRRRIFSSAQVELTSSHFICAFSLFFFFPLRAREVHQGEGDAEGDRNAEGTDKLSLRCLGTFGRSAGDQAHRSPW